MRRKKVLGKIFEHSNIFMRRNAFQLLRPTRAAQRGDGADVVRINKRLYIDGIGGKYRIPDVYFPQSGTILDGTLGTKTLNTLQIIDFRAATGNADIGIVRPQSFGGSYWIKK